MILAHALTDAAVDDATTGIDLIEAVDGHLASVTADAAYDTVAFYAAASAQGATVIGRPSWRTPSFDTSPSLEMAFEPVVQAADWSRRAWRAMS